MQKRIITLFLILFSFSTLASAQQLKIGPQLGLQKANDADEGKLMIGAALRAKLSPKLGLEGSINYRQEEYANGAATVKSWPVMVTGLIYPLPFLYGAVGAGWYNTTIDYDETINSVVKDKTSQETGWHFGFGLELPIGNNKKLIGDVRYVLIDYNFDQIPNDLDANFKVITIGLLFGL